MKKDTSCGAIEGKFDNNQEIKDTLNSTTVPKFFDAIKSKGKRVL